MQFVRASVKCSILFLALVVFLSMPTLAASASQTAPQMTVHGLPVEFEPNRGQATPEVRYITRTVDGQAQLMADRLRIVQSGANQQSIFELRFPGAKPAQILEESLTGGVVNYYKGQNRASWVDHIPLYRQIRYQGIYPGTDLIFHGNGSRLEYDFELNPGTDPDHLQIDVGSAAEIEPQKDGSLLITSGGHSLRLLAPSAFQHNGAETTTVHVAYQMLSPSKVGFALGPYDRTKKLTIDPVVTYANLISANSGVQVASIATDTNGDLVMIGTTNATNYPVVNGLPGSTSSSQQIFVTKLDPTGENILYSTYLPASGFSVARAVAVDANDNAYVAGVAGGADFPLTSQNLGTCSSSCYAGFVTKLDPSGAIAYSTLLASGLVQPRAIAVNANGNAFVSGSTQDNSLQVVNAFQSDSPGSAFYAELNAHGTGYVFSSYLGVGTSANGIALDKDGNVYVAGLTSGPGQSSIPLKGELQSQIGGFFLNKFTSDGKTLLFGSFLGGDISGNNAPETLSGVAVSSDGTVYLAGDTASRGFPYTLNAYRHPLGYGLYGSTQMFAMALNPSLTSLVYSTYLGDGFMYAMTVDSQGNLYAAGSTSDDSIQPKNAVVSDVTTGGVVLELDKTGNPVETSAFGGRIISQLPAAMTIDPTGNIYLAGSPGGSSTPFPFTGGCSGQDPIVVGGNAYSTLTSSGNTCGSTYAAFFAKISPDAKPQISLGYLLPFLPLHNVGSADLHISNVTFTGGLAKAQGNCGSTVPAGSSCVLTLTDANGKLAQGSVTITSDASPAVQTFTPYLDSRAVGSPASDFPWFDLSQLYFPPQQTNTSSAPHPLRIWNIGAANLTLQSIMATGSLLQTHDCTTILAPGTYCTVQVVWKPTDGSAQGNAVSIGYDNLTGSYYYVPSQYLTSSTPLLVSETSAISFGTQTVGNPSFYRTVTVTNVSNAPASAPNASLSGASEFTLSGNTCTTSLAPQQSCIIAVLFTPVIDGDRSATLDISEGAAASIQLNGTGQINSAVSVSPLQLLWPQTVFGSGYALDEKLTNISSASVPISNIAFSLADYSETDDCSGTVPAGASCTVHVMFQPQDLGTRNGTMTINFGGQTNAQVITLLGNSLFPLLLSPASVDFGTNNPAGTPSPVQTVYLSNPYSAQTINYTLAIDGPFTFDNKCPNPMPGHYGCPVSVAFNPTSAGAQTGSLTVNIPGVTKNSSIAFTGTAYTPPSIGVASSLSFGGVATETTSTLALSVSDTGSQDLAISGLAMSGENAADFSVASGQCPTIGGGSSCNVNISFHPSATGDRSAVLSITGNAANSPQTVTLTGTGVGPTVSIGAADGGSFTSTVPSGQPATFNLTLAGSAAFSGNVTLACSGAPQNATCSVTPATLALTPGGSQPFSVKVATQSSTTAHLDGAAKVFMASTGIGSLLVGSLFLFRRRRSWSVVMVCAVGILVSLAVTACGGGSSDTKPPATSTPANTPAGTYKLTVTATAGMISTSQVLTLIVQ